MFKNKKMLIKMLHICFWLKSFQKIFFYKKKNIFLSKNKNVNINSAFVNKYF